MASPSTWTNSSVMAIGVGAVVTIVSGPRVTCLSSRPVSAVVFASRFAAVPSPGHDPLVHRRLR
ncbi:hypothetical protein MO973_41110 [Paenibacillus sp. TRM 82003]|nr:hypothetical protein [Paenibacillus sp. TRM 82003]